MIQEEKDIIVVEKFLTFKIKKLDNLRSFEERYAPVIEYWMRKTTKRLGYLIVSNEIQFFREDRDNFIKNLITIRLRLECQETILSN